MKKRILSLIFLLLLLGGCKKNLFVENEEKPLPNFPEASADTNSWLQWKDYDDSEVNVSWYVDDATFNYNQSSLVAKRIKEVTGVNIQFQVPAIADGSKLSTMIAGNRLTDIITTAANTPEHIQLAESNKYLWSITDLAEKWAPTLLTRLEEEMLNLYSASDGELYGLPSQFSSYNTFNNVKARGGRWVINGSIMARKDYLDAYHSHMRATNPNFDESSVTTPTGIYEMAMWVKETYNLSNSNPTVLLAPFENQRTHGSLGIRWLAQYFSALEEDKDGNWQYQWDTPEFEKMMLWLNKLYRSGLMTSGNMSATATQVGSYIQQGLPFIFIGSPTSFNSQFKNWILNTDYESRYVPIIFSNEDKVVPQLAVTGNSYMFTMVSQNAKRPDRIIKLLDFLYSPEGQTLIHYGLEASGPGAEPNEGTFYYVKRPGEKEIINGKEVTWDYGKIELTDIVIDDIRNLRNGSVYGFFTPSVARTGNFANLTTAHENHAFLYSFQNYVSLNYNMALNPYAYLYKGFEFELDPTDKDYMRAVTLKNNLRLLWMQYYASIITASTEDQARTIYKQTIESAYRRGLEEYVEITNRSFQAHKQKLGILFANPINDPNNTKYQSLTLDSVYGDPSEEIPIPDEIPRR
jgi:putative aldouronate transport system substrate-binding protein